MECESPQGSQRHAGGQGHQQVYSQQSWSGPNDGQGSNPSSHSQQSHRYHSAHHRGQQQSPPSGTHSQMSLSHANSASLIIGPGFQSSATQPPQSGRTVDIVPGSHTRIPSTSDPPQIGAVNMQLSGYSAQYGPYPQPQWPGTGFGFTLATSVETQMPGPENPAIAQHTRTSSERGDESPMVGVVVQQSPVASHWRQLHPRFYVWNLSSSFVTKCTWAEVSCGLWKISGIFIATHAQRRISAGF